MDHRWKFSKYWNAERLWVFLPMSLKVVLISQMLLCKFCLVTTMWSVYNTCWTLPFFSLKYEQCCQKLWCEQAKTYNCCTLKMLNSDSKTFLHKPLKTCTRAGVCVEITPPVQLFDWLYNRSLSQSYPLSYLLPASLGYSLFEMVLAHHSTFYFLVSVAIVCWL